MPPGKSEPHLPQDLDLTGTQLLVIFKAFFAKTRPLLTHFKKSHLPKSFEPLLLVKSKKRNVWSVYQ